MLARVVDHDDSPPCLCVRRRAPRHAPGMAKVTVRVLAAVRYELPLTIFRNTSSALNLIVHTYAAAVN